MKNEHHLLDLALTGGVGSVRLLDTAGVIGTARLPMSGRARKYAH